jgi:hypothetical protein
MSKINVLAVSETGPIRTKAALTQLIKTSTELVTFVPIPVPSNPAHEAVRGNAYEIPAATVVTVHSPTGRKWTAQVSRTNSHVFSVK